MFQEQQKVAEQRKQEEQQEMRSITQGTCRKSWCPLPWRCTHSEAQAAEKLKEQVQWEMQGLEPGCCPRPTRVASRPVTMCRSCHHAWRRNGGCFTCLPNLIRISCVANPNPKSYREVLSLLSMYTVKSHHRALESTRAIISLQQITQVKSDRVAGIQLVPNNEKGTIMLLIIIIC